MIINKDEEVTTVTIESIVYVKCDCCGWEEKRKENKRSTGKWGMFTLGRLDLDICPCCSILIAEFIEGLGK